MKVCVSRLALTVGVAFFVAAMWGVDGRWPAHGGESALLGQAESPESSSLSSSQSPSGAFKSASRGSPSDAGAAASDAVTSDAVTSDAVASDAVTSDAVASDAAPRVPAVAGLSWAESGAAEFSPRNIWLLVSSVLVLTMVAPGLAMFYGGLVRKKNVLGVIMQCVFLLGLMPTLWGLYGYSLAFGGGARSGAAHVTSVGSASVGTASFGSASFGSASVGSASVRTASVGDPSRAAGPTGLADRTASDRTASDRTASGASEPRGERPWGRLIGDLSHVGLRGVQPRWSAEAGRPVAPLRGGVPVVSHLLFHGMLFTVAAAVMGGAFAERMRFVSFALFAALWGTVVYCPLCHWIWDGGLLAFRSGWAGGAIDFAGGVPIHVSAGVSALVCALVMGKRLGHGNEPMPPHNLTYTTLGAALLWAGWFGFNAGRASEHDGVLSMPMAATQFAAAAGTLAWAGAEWWTRGRPSVLGACSGAVAGLVCVTPAAGYVALPAALAMGLAAGLACCFACNRLKTALGYDDSLDAFGVHGVGGVLGLVLTGVFATRDVADPTVSLGGPLGLVDGSGGLIVGQLVAAGVAAAYSAVATFILLKLLDATLGLRVTHDEEIQGLDVSQHGEEGYIFL